MFKDEIALIRFLGREFIAMFNVFFSISAFNYFSADWRY